jgi:hypothetical protein
VSAAERGSVGRAEPGRSRHVGRTQQAGARGTLDPCAIGRASSAVETPNLRRAIAGGRNPRGDRRCRLARRAQGHEGCRTGVATPVSARSDREHPRTASREARRGARNFTDVLPPEPECLEGRGNAPRGVSARLKRRAEAVGTSQSSGGDERRAFAPIFGLASRAIVWG